MKSLNIVVADHQPIFAEGVCSVLSASNQMYDACNILGIARTGSQLRSLLKECSPDLLLLDPSLPEVDGVDIVPDVKQKNQDLRVLIVTMHNDPRLVKAALKLGADGYVLKTSSKDELRSAVREIALGHIYIGEGIAANTRVSHSGDQATPLLEDTFAKKYNLTRREIEIIRYIGQALTNKEIGGQLYISDQTVSVHRKNIMRKLRVNSTASLIKIVFENNLAETYA
jgi:DNA-binding NarL/FixJ family response regulator